MALLLFQEDDEDKRNQDTSERYAIRSLRAQDMLNDADFKMSFRVSRSNFELILQELGPHLKEEQAQCSVTPENKLLLTLQFLSQGTYQVNLSNESSTFISKASFSDILHEVVDCMNAVLCPKYITFPNSIAEMKKTMNKVQQSFKLPGVIGFIDGTHFRIVSPKGSDFPAFIYVNRQNYHSINVQIICDDQYRILNVNAKFPGSTKDSHIWSQSQVREHLLMNFSNERAWLLSDSGYPLEPNLMTPFRIAPNQGADLYNKKHKAARSTVERCIGALKMRWRCLSEERGLHYAPTMASKIINACVALHNVCLLRDSDYYIESPHQQEELHIDYSGPYNNNLFVKGSENRQLIIDYLLLNSAPHEGEIM